MKKLFIFTFALCFLNLTGFSWAESEIDWKEHKARHFMIYYNNAPRDFVKEVEESAEEYYENISRDLGFTRYESWNWDRKASIYIYDDLDSYVKGSKQARWSHGAAWTRQRKILTFPSAHGFFDSVLPHELGHIIFREFIGFEADIPLWFEEGVAMYQEKARRYGANKEVLKAIENGTFIPLTELSNVRLTSRTPKEIVNLFYAQSASVVYYLIKDQSQYRFTRMCRKLRDGDSFEDALKEAYVRFKNVEDLNRQWINYLE